MNNKKLDGITYLDGKALKDSYRNIFIFMLSFMIIMSGAYLLLSNESMTFEFIGIGMLMSVFILTISFSYQIFNQEYYQLVRYYQLSLQDVHKYLITNVYAVKNLIYIIVLTTLGALVISVIPNGDGFVYASSIVSALIATPAIVSLSFYMSTFIGKRNWIPKGIILVLTFSLLIVTTVSIEFMETSIRIPVITSGSVLVTLCIYGLLNIREKKLEV